MPSSVKVLLLPKILYCLEIRPPLRKNYDDHKGVYFGLNGRAGSAKLILINRFADMTIYLYMIMQQ